MGTMRILDRSGDTLLTWDPADSAAVREAEELFVRLAAEHKLAFARPAGAGADETEQVRHFDPEAEEIIWVRPITGG